MRLKYGGGLLRRERPRMGGSAGEGLTIVHVKRLLKMVAAGSAVFSALLFALQALLVHEGLAPDSSFYDFYPIMAALGVAFGFERWWATMQGE